MVIEQGAQSRKGGGVYRGYLIFLTFLLQLQRGSDLFNPQAASDVSVANQTEILWVQFFTHRDNHKVYSVVAPHCTQQDPGFEAASGLCEPVPTPRQRISSKEPMECVDMDETALPDPGWKTFKSKELQAASVFLVGHLAMQVLAANSKPMVGSMVLLGALLCIGIIWILGWKTLKSKELQERKDFMKQKNRDPETRPKKIGRSCWFKSCGRSHGPACRDFRPSGGYKLADPPWEDPLCHGTPFGTDPKLCESEPTSLLTTVLSSLCLLWVILRWFPLIGKAAPSLWKTIACRRISSKEPMECVDMVETADPGTTTAAELFYPFHLRSRACSASGRGTGGAGGTSSAVSLMLNPILLLTALVESALLGDQSWRIWVQVIGFLITVCLLLCNCHLKLEKCKCLSLALVLVQLPIGCSFAEALVRCLCAWAFPMFPAQGRCRCGRCQPEWLFGGWVCPGQEMGRFKFDHGQSAEAGTQSRAAADRGHRFDYDPIWEVLEESKRTAAADEQRRAAAERERLARLSGKCVVCFEDSNGGVACCNGSTPTTDAVAGSALHFICGQCIPEYIQNELENDDNSDSRLMERRAFGHTLRCPCGRTDENCGGYLQEEHVGPFLTSEHRSSLQAAKEADEKHRQWQRESRDNEDPEALREALLRSMPNAVQCGRCKYGPIDRAGCADMDAHHKEWQGNAQIRNQCPKCGWRHSDIRFWPAWDGVMRQ